MGDEDVGANDAVPTDDGAAAQDGSACIDGHMVFNGGMALFALQALASPGGEGTQRDTLVDLYMIADGGGLADDDTGAMVDEEVFADGGTGVDVDAGNGVRMLGHDPGQHGNTHGVKDMGQPVNGNGKQAGIAEDDLIYTEGGRVALKEGLHIGLGNSPDSGNLPEELNAQLLGLFLCSGFLHGALQHQADLLVQVIHYVLNQHRQIVPGIIDPVGLLLGVAGINDSQQLADHINDDLLVRIALGCQLVDGPAMAVILQNGVNNAFNLGFDGSHRKFLLNLHNLPNSLS